MRVVGRLAVALCVGSGVVLAACGTREGQGRPTPAEIASWSGLYLSDTLAGAGARQLLWLTIGPDTTASVSLEFVGVGTTFHPGRWTARGDRLTMQPTRGDGTPNEVAFRWRLEGAKLIPLEWDRTVYGDRAVTLTKYGAPAAPADTTAGATR